MFFIAFAAGALALWRVPFPHGTTRLLAYGGYFAIAVLLRSLVHRARAAPLQAELAALGADPSGRQVVADFASGFGGGFADAAADSGDVVGALIGSGIQFLSGVFGGSDPRVQRARTLQQRLAALETARTWFVFGMMVVCGVQVFFPGTLPRL